MCYVCLPQSYYLLNTEILNTRHSPHGSLARLWTRSLVPRMHAFTTAWRQIRSFLLLKATHPGPVNNTSSWLVSWQKLFTANFPCPCQYSKLSLLSLLLWYRTLANMRTSPKTFLNLTSLVASNIGAIMVQHCKQYWVNIVTNIDPIYGCPRFSYIVPILARQYCANIDKPIMESQYWHNIVSQYWQNIGKPWTCKYWGNIGYNIGPILLTMLDHYWFIYIAEYWRANIGTI